MMRIVILAAALLQGCVTVPTTRTFDVVGTVMVCTPAPGGEVICTRQVRKVTKSVTRNESHINPLLNP